MPKESKKSFTKGVPTCFMTLPQLYQIRQKGSTSISFSTLGLQNMKRTPANNYQNFLQQNIMYSGYEYRKNFFGAFSGYVDSMIFLIYMPFPSSTSV